jgi:adenosylhomocysteine nucleosidase
MQERIIGIMGALPEEINGIVQLLEEKQAYSSGKRTYFTGKIQGIQTVVVFSRWGKVAAATTVATLLLRFHVTEIIFTGVAGAIQPELNIGDVVIAKRLIQHDLDGRPLMAEFEIPLLNISYIEVRPKQLNIASKAVNRLIDPNRFASIVSPEERKQFNISNPKLWMGDIASGDKFFAKNSDKEALIKKLPEVLCVEMEGAAVAQVCYEYDIPFTVIRTVSDTADERSAIDFPGFTGKIANKYAIEIIQNILQQYIEQ